ncbi:MAG: (Fe-S)-binding protein [Deltaproteobacteria bacterium]|nr:(Fe-S)-binding protein [Deltaproteobacteria bacterium]
MTRTHIAEEFDQCNKCGLCHATCPVGKELLLEKYSPRGKIQLARFYHQGALDLSDHFRDIFAKCLLCGACKATCPSGVDLDDVFVRMRGEIAKKRGTHPLVDGAVRSLLDHHNISAEDNAERGDWREDMKDPPGHMYQKDRADVLYFVGCVSSFFPMVQAIPQNFVRILDLAGVDFTILAGEEWCCGFPLTGAGASEGVRGMMEHNLEKARSLGVKTVVFSCPSCYRMWKEHYDIDLELFHDTQFIERMIRDGAISLGEVNTSVTYHDPCDLGRHAGVFEAPREILKSIPGLTLKELENNGARSFCCGGGGNLEMTDPRLSRSIAGKKIKMIRETGADAVVTSCQQCVRTIKGWVRREKIDLHVMDMTELVLQAVSNY